MFGDVEIKERPGDLKVQDGIIMDVKHLTRKGKFQDCLLYTSLSSFTGHPGTKVKEVAKRMEKSYISSVAKNVNIARIALIGVPNEIGTSFKVFSLLAQNHICLLYTSRCV